MKVLIVEDELMISMALSIELKKHGYSVIEQFSTGEKTLEFVELNDPDLILMDITLGGQIDGIETVTAIQQKKCIPIIYLTGYSDEITRNRAMKTKPIGILSKPFLFEKLRQLIAEQFPDK